MRRIKRLTNPYRGVLGTYLHRRFFWLLLAAYALNFDRFIVLALTQIGVRADLSRAYFVISDLTDPLMQIAFPVVVGVVLMAHLREQLAGPSRILVPHYIRPTLRSALIAFAIALLAMAIVPIVTDSLYTFINRLSFHQNELRSSAWEAYGWNLYNLPGGLIITCTAMTVGAWLASFGTPWITLALLPILWAAFLAARINPWWFYYELVRDRFYVNFYTGHFPLRFFYMYLTICRFFLLFICVPVLFNTFALIALCRRIKRMATTRLMDGAPSPTLQPKSGPIILHRAKLPSGWSRLRHIRSASISAAAPWIVALLLAAILMVIPTVLIGEHHPEMQMQISLILMTILPSVAVTVLWAERWPRLGVESLLPASRHQFVIEMIAAMAIDLLHFWFAIAVAAVLPLLLLPLMPLNAPMFAERIIASALMQPLALAAILWAMWFRSWPVLMALLGVAVVAMAGPVAYSTKNLPLIPVATLLHASLAVGVIGLAVSAAAYRRWLTGNFA